MRFLAICLLFLSTLAHAGKGDFLKATVNGKPYELKGDDLYIVHDPGGSDSDPHQTYILGLPNPFAAMRMELAFYLPVGGALKTGAYPVPDPPEESHAKPYFVQLKIIENADPAMKFWSLTDAADGEVVITAIKGKVVTGTFRGKLRSPGEPVREVTNGTFRFTMD